MKSLQKSDSAGSIPTGGNILPLDFFHVVKPLIPILPLLPILSICEKPECKGLINFDFQAIHTYMYINAKGMKLKLYYLGLFDICYNTRIYD